MGSENSKSDNDQISEKNRTTRNISERQRLYTEDEIQRALANQKRMFEAKQLHIQRSSTIYPNLQTLNHHTVNSQSTSNVVPYHVTPSAPPENDLPHVRYTAASRQSHQQTNNVAMTRSAAPSFARPSHVTTPTAGPSHVRTPTAGPSHVTKPTAGPSHVTTPTTGPSHVTTPTAGLLHAQPASNRNQIWNQSPRRFATPPSAGPSHLPASQRNQSRSRASARSSSRNRNNRGVNQMVNCVTCDGQLGLHIYQCTNGHSSCDGCRFKMARCGRCAEQITDMRNITLESTLADVTINAEDRVKCTNATDGCCLHFKRAELQNHLKECPFNIISCPTVELSEDCQWKGTIKQLKAHFDDAHPEHCKADVNKEMHIILLELDYKVMYFVNIGMHKFLVHIQLNGSLNNIYMAAQHLGTNFSAAKWIYEWHIYNKKESRRKFEYIDVCKSNTTPVSEIINDNNCAVISLDHAKTFLDDGKLTFKFYIKKQFNNKKNVDATHT